MATRHLKKLKQQLQKEEVVLADSVTDGSDEEVEDATSKTPFNPFDLLSDNEDAGPSTADEAVDSDHDDTSDNTTAAVHTSPQLTHKPESKTGKAAKSKKSKSKKKGKSKQSAAASDDASDGGDATANGHVEEDIDAIMQELNLSTGNAATTSSSATASRATGPPLLGVDPRQLRGEDELRRIFGVGVVEAVERQEAAEAGNSGHHAGGGLRHRSAMPRNMPRRRAMRKGVLVAPRDNWPYLDSGLSMELCGAAPDGSPQFKYIWSPAYRAMQSAFETAQGSHDPNAIAALLQQCPYHVDCLLAMYDLHRAMGEGQYAEEVLSRALYALEMAWHPSFDVSRGHCRLGYEVPENRPLFVALFRHAQALSRQGCHASGLEVAKLLLALDPEDPMGALCMIDYLAIRAGQYTFLHRLVREFDRSQALALLPHFSYSLALARFRQEQEQSSGGSSTGKKQATASATTTKEADASTSSRSSHDLLVQALLLHPVVLPRLMARLQDKGVGKDAGWQQILNAKLFSQASDGSSPSLAHLISIFVERSHMLWKAPAEQEWLKAAAQAAAHAADSGQQSATTWAMVATESFPASDTNEYRHLRLHDFSDNVNALPREELHAAMAAGGMADVEDAVEEQLVALLQQQQEAVAALQAARHMSDEELRQANPLLMLLRSMLPWVNAGVAPEYGAADGEGDGRQQQQPPAPGQGH